MTTQFSDGDTMTEIKRGPTDYLAETILVYIKENAELRAQNDQLLSQLPEGMEDCTIVRTQCEKGHGNLTCLVCHIERLNAALKEAQLASRPEDGGRK